MPRGRYLVAGRSEAFSCAPGPAGWRSVSRWTSPDGVPGSLDLVCDSGFRAVRFSLTSGGAWLRGGGLRLNDGAPVLEWVVGSGTDEPDPDRVRRATVSALLTASPASLVALLRGVADPGSGSAAADLAVLVVDDAALGALSARRSVRRVGAETHEALDADLLVETWHVDDPDTGARVVAHLAGDVVLAAEGDDPVELAELESPPWSGERPR